MEFDKLKVDQDLEENNGKPKSRSSSIVSTLDHLSKSPISSVNTSRWCALSLFISVVSATALTLFLLNVGGSQNNNRGEDLIFTNLGEVRQRLHSKSDMPVYEFLTLHHETAVLHGEERNVVSEVFRALNHNSAEEGLPLLIELFSDLYFVWPPKIPDETLVKLWQLQGEEEIRRALLYDLSLSEERDEIEKANEAQLKKILTRVMDVDGCIPYLKQIDRVRVLDFHGSPYGKKALLPTSRNKKRAKAAAAAEADEANATTSAEGTALRKPPPTEENLLHATQSLTQLEQFVAGKDELNDILRSMLLDDLVEMEEAEEAEAAAAAAASAKATPSMQGRPRPQQASGTRGGS